MLFFCNPKLRKLEAFMQEVSGFPPKGIKSKAFFSAPRKSKKRKGEENEVQKKTAPQHYEMYSYDRIDNIKQRYDGGSMFGELLIANYDLNERLNSDRQISFFETEDLEYGDI